MSISRFLACALAVCVALPIFGGCDAVRPAQDGTPLPASAPGETSKPLRQDRSGALLWVVGDCRTGPFDEMCIFTFPYGHVVGKLEYYAGSAPRYMCSDQDGNVFVTATASGSASQVQEYRHSGGGPIAILNDGYYYPNGCARDPKTGNLAVANSATESGPGNVAVYENATGGSTIYKAPGFFDYDYCGFDDAGNLYVSGRSKSGAAVLAKLPKGTTKFQAFSLDKKLRDAGPIQWDGHYLAVGYGNGDNSIVYRVSVSGFKGTVAGSTVLRDPDKGYAQIGAFWIAGDRIVSTYRATGGWPVGIWNYPAGGEPVRNIRRGGGYRQRSLTVSVSR